MANGIRHRMIGYDKKGSKMKLVRPGRLAAPLLALLLSVCVATFAGADPAPIPQVVDVNGHLGPILKPGWMWINNVNAIKPDSGRRNNVFYVGDPVTFKLGGSAVEWEVRDYYGDMVDHGPAAAQITVKATEPGWYKLYVYGQHHDPPAAGDTSLPWGDVVGGTTFVIYRRDPHFPTMPPADADYNSSLGDEVTRGVAGIGPQRYGCSSHKGRVLRDMKDIDAEIAVDKQFYLPYDPVRKRVLFIAFSSGTEDLDNVKMVVEHFQKDVQYYEPRNEPNYGSSGADFVKNELIPFYNTVKSVNPNLKVMGPGTVSIGPSMKDWLTSFFEAGGAKYIDCFSFHAYNTINGDPFMGEWSMDWLAALLAKYNVPNIEKWQTEQGYFACVYGDYEPRLQGRWTMLQMMIYEQHGIPKEHNDLWYDVSHGFWDFPAWWENDDGGYNPAVPLMRVWSEELYGTNFSRALDMGPNGNHLYLGSEFKGPGKTIYAFQSFGSTDGRVELHVSGGRSLHTVSPFGVDSEIPVTGGYATLDVPELPVYVEPARGQAITVVPQDYGTNLARLPGVTASSSGDGKHFVDPTIPNDLSKIHNGIYENWYWEQQPIDRPWMDDTPGFPAWVELDLPTAQPVRRVVVYSCPPWQWDGTLTDFDVQVDDGSGHWVTVATVNEPLKTWPVFSPPTKTVVDSYFSDRWVFNLSFKTVTTSKIRLFVRNTTYGGGATLEATEGGGQTGPHKINLREVEIYAK